MSNPLATVTQAARVSLIATMANRYGMDPQAFQSVIRATVMPSSATNEQMAAFLMVANEYDLNPVTKEIYAFPAKGGGVTPVVGIDGWVNLAQRRQEFDGMEHEYSHDANGKLVSCTCRIYRKDRTRPVVVTEFMDECARNTDPWKSHPRRMLRHKATIQAIRYAFGFSGIKDEDDAEVIYGTATVVSPAPIESESVRKRLMEQARQLPQPAPAIDPRPSEWPQPNADGEMVDSRGCPWIAEAHSAGQSVNDTGEWRRKRGVDPAAVERLEREAMAPEVAEVAEIEGEQTPADAPEQGGQGSDQGEEF